VVPDPVDPGRNVAAALTLDRMLQFVAASRCFLRQPGMEFFFPEEAEPLSDEEMLSQIQRRGTELVLLEFSLPPVVDDVIFPQLRKGEAAVRSLLERNGFSILRSDVSAASGRAWILLELEVWHLPEVVRRVGPPVWKEEHLRRFLSSHPEPLSGPYILDGRAVLEERRKHRSARDLLVGEMGSLSLGRHLTREVQRGYKIYAGQELAGIGDREFRIFMACYLRARLRIC
jgi:tRNA nucleotidyltransferase (CCA-adding enzyme)